MSQHSRIRRKLTTAGLSAMVLLGANLSVTVQAAPAEPPGSSAPADTRPGLQAQLKDVDAQLASERAHNAELQQQVARMEQQNADRAKQLQQRDDQIADLQKRLQAAGVPASSGSAGP